MPPPRPAPASLQQRDQDRAGQRKALKGLDLADLSDQANMYPAAEGGSPEGIPRSYLSYSTPTSLAASRAHPPLTAPPLRISQHQQLEPVGFAATFTPSGAPGQKTSLSLPLISSRTLPREIRTYHAEGSCAGSPQGAKASLGPKQMTILWWVQSTNPQLLTFSGAYNVLQHN